MTAMMLRSGVGLLVLTLTVACGTTTGAPPLDPEAVAGADAATVPDPAAAAAVADPDAAYYTTSRALLAAPDAGAMVDQVAALDFTRFRRGAMLATATGTADAAEKAFARSVSAADSTKVLPAARALLAVDAAHIKAHAAASNVLDQQGNAAAAALHGAFIKGLLGSIGGSGDGKTAATAFHIFFPREADDLVGAVGLTVLKRERRSEGERTLDVLTVQRPGTDRPPRELFFDLSASKRR